MKREQILEEILSITIGLTCIQIPEYQQEMSIQLEKLTNQYKRSLSNFVITGKIPNLDEEVSYLQESKAVALSDYRSFYSLYKDRSLTGLEIKEGLDSFFNGTTDSFELRALNDTVYIKIEATDLNYNEFEDKLFAEST